MLLKIKRWPIPFIKIIIHNYWSQPGFSWFSLAITWPNQLAPAALGITRPAATSVLNSSLYFSIFPFRRVINRARLPYYICIGFKIEIVSNLTKLISDPRSNILPLGVAPIGPGISCSLKGILFYDFIHFSHRLSRQDSE